MYYSHMYSHLCAELEQHYPFGEYIRFPHLPPSPSPSYHISSPSNFPAPRRPQCHTRDFPRVRANSHSNCMPCATGSATSISTPTSPTDSNVSSVGTLEVPNHSCLSLSPPDSPHTSHPAHCRDPSADLHVLGSVPSHAHDWSRDMAGGIRTRGGHFIDAYGRVCSLRGANLSGSCT
jgi:hypothetical protein